MRYPQGYPPVCQRPLFGHILQTTCTYRPTRCGSLRFRMFCVLCQDSLRGVSSVNLECGFVWVWPQRQTFVGKSLTLTIQNRTSAQSSRPTFLQLLHAPQRPSVTIVSAMAMADILDHAAERSASKAKALLRTVVRRPIVNFRVLKKEGVCFLFLTRFPVKKGAKKRPEFFWGRRLWGAVGSRWPLAREHVLLLAFGCPLADKVARRTRPSLWATQQPRRGALGTLETVRLWPLSSVVVG